MKSEAIKELLENYFAGDSSLEEEKLLKEVFRKNPGLSIEFPEASLFLAFAMEKDMEPKKSLVPNLEPATRNWTWVRIAATILILIGTLWIIKPEMFNQRNSQVFYEDSFSNPDEAYEEATKALAMVGKKINSGKSNAAMRVYKINNVLPVK